MEARWPLVGRTDVLDTAVQRLRGERPALLLAGEPGVGKSRLAREVAAQLADRRVRRIVGSPGLSALPFAAVGPLLATTPSSLDAVPGEVWATLDAGAVLLVDDAQWLDAATAELVHRLVVNGVCPAVVTARYEPLPAAIEALVADGYAERLALEPLDAPTTRAMVEARLGGALAATAAGQLHDTTGGNPMLVREVVERALADGTLTERRGSWFLAELASSASIAELVGERLEALRPEVRHAAALVAIAEDLGRAGLVALVGDEVVDDAEANDVLVVGFEGRRQPVRLAHPLLAEVLLQRMPTDERRTVHLQLADHLAATRTARPLDAVRIALFRLEAGVDVSVEVLLDAARRLTRVDPALAAHLAEAAVERGGGLDARSLQVEALHAAGRTADAIATLRLTFDEVGDDDAVDVACRLAGLLSESGEEGAALAALARAEQRCPGDDTLAAARVQVLASVGRASEALADGRRLLDDDVAGLALRRLGGAMTQSAALAGAPDVVALQRAEEALGGVAVPTHGRSVSALGLVLQGRILEAEEEVDVAYDDCATSAAAHGLLAAAAVRSFVVGRRGRCDEAVAMAREAVALAEQLGDAGLLRGGLGLLALAHADAGWVDEAAEAVARLDAEEATGPASPALRDVWEVRGRVWAAAAAGRIDDAAGLARVGASSARELGQDAVEVLFLHDLVRLGFAGGVVLRLAELGDAVAGPAVVLAHAHAVASLEGNTDELLAVADRWAAMGAPGLAAEVALLATGAYEAGGRHEEADVSRQQAAAWLDETDLVLLPLPGLQPKV